METNIHFCYLFGQLFHNVHYRYFDGGKNNADIIVICCCVFMTPISYKVIQNRPALLLDSRTMFTKVGQLYLSCATPLSLVLEAFYICCRILKLVSDKIVSFNASYSMNDC